MIQISNLTKVYQKTLALDSVSFSFENGKIYGLLGGNGAGKTTLINILTNRIIKTSGEILVDGQPVEENEAVQGKIFCITEKAKYPGSLNASELFRWEKEFYPQFDIPYAETLAEKFELPLKKKISSLSTGYSTILKTILTLASHCEIMVLDEPVLGIDSLYREQFYDALLEYHQKHKNLIIIATHLIDEVERVLENVVVISKGHILKAGPISDFVLNGKRLNETYVQILKEGKNGTL